MSGPGPWMTHSAVHMRRDMRTSLRKYGPVRRGRDAPHPDVPIDDHRRRSELSAAADRVGLYCTGVGSRSEVGAIAAGGASCALGSVSPRHRILTWHSSPSRKEARLLVCPSRSTIRAAEVSDVRIGAPAPSSSFVQRQVHSGAMISVSAASRSASNRSPLPISQSRTYFRSSSHLCIPIVRSTATDPHLQILVGTNRVSTNSDLA